MSLLALVGSLFTGAGRNTRNDPIKDQQEYADRMAREAAVSNMNKMYNDNRSAKLAGLMDSSNKNINAMISAAKGINF